MTTLARFKAEFDRLGVELPDKHWWVDDEPQCGIDCGDSYGVFEFPQAAAEWLCIGVAIEKFDLALSYVNNLWMCLHDGIQEWNVSAAAAILGVLKRLPTPETV